jgi:hypothetical protein
MNNVTEHCVRSPWRLQALPAATLFIAGCATVKPLPDAASGRTAVPVFYRDKGSMKRPDFGRYAMSIAGSHEVRAFVPAPLPPIPPLEFIGTVRAALDQALLKRIAPLPQPDMAHSSEPSNGQLHIRRCSRHASMPTRNPSQIPTYHAQPFCSEPILPRSSNSSVTTILSRNLTLL